MSQRRLGSTTTSSGIVRPVPQRTTTIAAVTSQQRRRRGSRSSRYNSLTTATEESFTMTDLVQYLDELRADGARHPLLLEDDNVVETTQPMLSQETEQFLLTHTTNNKISKPIAVRARDMVSSYHHSC